MAYIRLPNNSYFPVAEGESPKQALEEARKAYPKAFMTEGEIESKQGFLPAAGDAFKRAKAGTYEAAGKLFGSETLKDLALKEQKELEEKPGFIPTTEEDRTAAFKKGLGSGIGALAREYISEPVGGIVGRYGVPLAVGAGASLAAPAVGLGAFGTAVAGGAATALTDYLPQVGENLERQRTVKQPEDLQAAALTGIPQAALSGLNLRLGMLPKPIQNIFKADAAALEKKVLEGVLKPEQAIAQLSGRLKNILLSTGSAAVVGAGTMSAEEMLRRQQAGQSLTDDEAIEDYKDIGKGALAIAPLFGIPRGMGKRGAEKRGIESASQKYEVTKGAEERARKDAEAAALADEQARTQEAEGYNRAVMDTFGAPERPAEGVQGRTGDLFGGTYAAPEGALPPQRALGDNLLPREREVDAQREVLEQQKEQERVKAANLKQMGGVYPEGEQYYGQNLAGSRAVLADQKLDALTPKSPQEVMNQERNLKQYVTGLRDQVSAAAAKADIKTLGELTPKLKEVEAAYAAAYKEYSALDIPEVKFQQLTDQITRKTKELQKAGGVQGDFAQIEKLTNDIQKLQAELEKVKPPSGPDLFAVEKEVVAKGKAEAAEALAQGQQDFLAQVGKPETRIDARQRQTLERYNDNVRQLDEAYAANADKRLIDKLVDSVQADAAERAAIIAKTSDTRTLAQEEASQQRIARITRAIAEAEAKQDTASVAGLRNQLAKAIVESARPDVSTRRNRALENQQAAIEELRSQVEDLALGRYLGKGSQDMATAASLKAGLERKANETVGRYVEAAIREVQAVREQNNHKKMTVTEATRMAMDIRGHLENAVRNKNEAALHMPDNTTVSPIERQLAQIKRKYHKGTPIETRRVEGQGLRQEFDRVTGDDSAAVTSVRMRRAEKALQTLESRDKPKSRSIARLKEIIAEEKPEGAGERLRRAEQTLDALEGQVNPDRQMIARLKAAIAKERVLADKERAVNETRERQGSRSADESVSTIRTERETQQAERQKEDQAARELKQQQDQLDLFKAKDLEPSATTRATPENFMRLLRSGVVQELRSKLADIETIVPKVSKKEVAKAQQEKSARESQANEVAVQKATEAADKLRKAVANTEKYIQELNDKLSAVRMAVPTVKNPDAKPSPELVRQRKAVLKEREAIAKQFEKKGTSLNKQLVEQKERLRAAEAKVTALEKVNEDKPFESFASQIEKQRRVVEEVAAAEELAGNLRHNANQLWVMSGRAKIELEKAVTEQKEIAAKLKDARETKRGLEKDNEANLRQAEGNPDFAEEFINKTKVQIAEVNKEIDGLKKKDVAAQEKVRLAEESVRELREEAPKRMAEIDRYNERANELLETNLKTERAILASMERQYARMTKTSPEAKAFAKQMTELRKQTAVSEREFSLSREKRNKETRDLEEAQAESDKLFRVTRQEIVGSNRKTQNVRELKKKEALEVALGKERDKATPDDNKIIRLERQLAALETTQEITRKQITREVPLATEAIKRETRLDEQVREREEAIARGEARKETGGVSRTKLADALKEESIVSAELKEIRRQLGNFTNVIVGLEKSAKATTKPEAIAAFEKRLKDARKNLEAKGLVEKEKALVDKLTELKKVGVGVERALEVIGPKAGREQRTNVKAPALTAEQVAARKAAAKQRKLLNEDFEHYLRTEDRAKRETVGPRAEYKGPSGTDYRAMPATEQRLDSDQSKRVTDIIEKNLPKDIKVKSVDSFAELPKDIKDVLARDGFVEGAVHADTIRGFVTPNGDVYVIRGNHATVKDLETTYVHEIIGHAGVDRLLGREGVLALTERIKAQGGAMELAKKLGVEKEVAGAINDYAMSIQKMTDAKAPTEQIKKAIDDMESQAVRELIAYTAEKRVDETFKQKAGRWLKELVGAVRDALRKMGFTNLADVSTSDIYNILRQSQRNYNRGELGAFRESNGQMAYSNKAVFADGFDEGMATATGKIIAQQKGFRDRIKGSVTGMSMMTRMVDRFAPLDYIARTMKDKLEGVQMMYNNRVYDQRNNMLAEIATHGSVGYKKGTDGTYQYKSRGGPSLKDVFETAAMSKNKVGNGQATTDFFGMYLAMERAAADKNGLAEGLNKLDFKGKVGITEANRILDFGRNDKNFQKARQQYGSFGRARY